MSHSVTESLSAPYTIEFPFDRTVGPKVGTFLGGLRDGQLWGVRTSTGAVLCPVSEFDPETGEETGDLVLLEPRGSVVSWTVGHDRAWALVNIDGTRGSFFHALDAGDGAAIATGMRVQVRWRAERVGDINDIECFEPEAAS